MKKRSVLCFLVACSLLAVTAAAQSSPDITITCSDVKVPVSGATETDSYAINNLNAIAGDYIDSAGVQHGLILAGTKVTKFDGPAGSSLIAGYGINNLNAVSGWYVDSTGVARGFVYANGKMTPIFYPGSHGTEANGINDAGWVVGSYFDSTGKSHGFYWDKVKYHGVNVKGASQTIFWAINKSNIMTAYTLGSTGAPQDAYTFKGGIFTKVDVPGATSSVTHGINTFGDIDYTIFDSAGNRHGVLYKASTKTFTTFDDPKGVNGTRADGINDKDTMVGRYTPPGKSNSVGFKCTVM